MDGLLGLRKRCEKTAGRQAEGRDEALPPRLPSEASANVSAAGLRAYRFGPTCLTSQTLSRPVSLVAFVPAYRCGAAPDLHRIPFSSSACAEEPRNVCPLYLEGEGAATPFVVDKRNRLRFPGERKPLGRSGGVEIDAFLIGVVVEELSVTAPIDESVELAFGFSGGEVFVENVEDEFLAD